MIPTKFRHSRDFMPLVRKIQQAGFENATFGENVGGYRIQQNPYELAALTMLLRQKLPLIPTYMELGFGAAGTSRFLYENWGWGRAVLVDDGRQFRAAAEKNLEHIQGARVFWTSTRSEKFPYMLLSNEWVYDVIFIDAGHARRDVGEDLKITARFAHENTLFIFHDIYLDGRWIEDEPDWYEHGGVPRFWQECPRLNHVLEIFDDSAACPLGLGIATLKPESL